MENPCIFIKFGGSLITDKAQPHTPRLEVMRRLAAELHNVIDQSPHTPILLGHGSGSFGHVPAKKYNTRAGVKNRRDWIGFSKVWNEAQSLNKILLQTLAKEGLHAIAFPPSAMVLAQDGKVHQWNITPIIKVLENRLLPVIYGDAVIDLTRGGTILSTEDLFVYLAKQLQPKEIYLFGIEPGVFSDYPQCRQIIPEITPENFPAIRDALGGSQQTDVTGGMLSKVTLMLNLVSALPHTKVWILSGEEKNTVSNALLGNPHGTCIHNKKASTDSRG